MPHNIAVLTSGGDAPGMNAAIRAVVRSALHRGWKVIGIASGFAGLLSGEFRGLTRGDVSGIIDKGGTFLRSARSAAFLEEEAQAQAVATLRAHQITGLIVIGGNGSQAGALALAKRAFPVVGIGATIDNDVFGTDLAIGVDTALNIALEAIDRIKVTAASHQRVFLVEVMGRDSGYLALVSGIAGGAELIVIPEFEDDSARMADQLLGAYQRGHAHAIAVVAEGARYDADAFSKHLSADPKYTRIDTRVTKLGHVQRGGAPGVVDRLLASRLGVAACDCFARGEHGVLVGMAAGRVAVTALSTVVSSKKILDQELIRLSGGLAD
ncbi:MAG TPA: ATP-dependent 6-phosphofructokinase [Candidatus Acidoferrales bacterium]|nr:ATP-dependent 6-phosphofructokinase [Candidatus Acidoferrales bacterium]